MPRYRVLRAIYEVADVEAADAQAAYEVAWENSDTKWEEVDAETVEIVEREEAQA